MRTYGTCQLLKGGTWRIDAEPHVLLRLRRVFPGQARKAGDTVRISHTEENCRDLLWFISRYPLETDPCDELEQKAKAHRDRASLVDALISGRRKPPEFDLTFPAREYQRVAADVLLKNGSLLLAVELGTGKTVSAIACFTDARTLPALFVTMTHLPRQIEAEINRFAPKLTTHILRGTKPYDLRAIGGRGRQLGLVGATPDVLITNYHRLAGWRDVLAGLCRMVVFDEAQELRHAKNGKDPTAKYSAAQHISHAADFRLLMTGTPIYGYGGEFFNLVEIMRPGCLGTHREFMDVWCKGDADKPKIKDPKAFGTYVREGGIMLRRTRSDVGRELPPLQKIPHVVDIEESVLDAVESTAADLARIILEQGAESKRGAKFMAAEELSVQLRQATGVAKSAHVAHFVRMLIEGGEPKVLLFGWHHEVYGIWRDMFAKGTDPIRAVFYTGKESVPQKEAAKDAFVNGDAQVMVMSLRAGAGIDGLQKVCSVCCFGELDWAYGVHEQATGRIFRDGQTKPVAAYYLIAESGSDPIVSQVLGVKRSQIDGIREPKRDILEKLETGEGNIKRLASEWLRQRGFQLPPDARTA